MASSITTGQFPMIVWRDGQKRLWNPIHRQALKNLPEERVRLRVVEYLLHGGWSKHRISTEEAINLPQKETALRTDLICYTQDFKPFLLVECKAENIKLSAKTADQIARYNQKVAAPFLLLTNGRKDFWYACNKGKSVKQINDIPESLPVNASPQLDFTYWQKRGFAGSKAEPNLRLWLNNTLQTCMIDSNAASLRYLSFKKRPSDVDLNNYYIIYTHDDSRIALGFTATEFGGSRLIGILNQHNQNKAVLEINLDMLFDSQSPNAAIYSTEAPQNIDIRKHLSDITHKPADLQNISKTINKLLQEALR